MTSTMRVYSTYLGGSDMDQAGADWAGMITTGLREKNRSHTVLCPPHGLDPDEAFLSGWWPPVIS